MSQQRLKALRITRLKNLENVTITFDEERPLTAIMGPNGSGKSTVLHALAATFKPSSFGEEGDCRFTDFFPNTPHGVWSGTEFTVSHSFRLGPATHTIATQGTKMTGQWLPIQKYKPARETFFIGVHSAVPKVEIQGTRRKVNYTTHDLIDEKSIELKEKVGIIFNRQYTKYHSNDMPSRRKLIGVEFRGVNFSALAMGAGEQRVFEILKTVIKARNYALILIDEIDLLLHGDALKKFLKILHEYAVDKKLQIVFTTHRESILEFEKFISVRHLYQTNMPPHKTFCFIETKPDAISRLTGEPHRTLSVACEDDVSTAIIEKVATESGVRKYTEISKFGAADNGFTLIAALMLNGRDLSNSIFVIDGDRYITDEEKVGRINRVLTGDHPTDQARRAQAPTYVRQFAPPTVEPPEKRLHALIRTVAITGEAEIDDVITASQAINVVANDHEYVDKIIEALGSSRPVGLTRIVNVAAKADGWNAYVAAVRAWFDEKRPNVIELMAN
nr:AAA family ATPase [Desulfuromonas sp. DDH964]